MPGFTSQHRRKLSEKLKLSGMLTINIVNSYKPAACLASPVHRFPSFSRS